MTTFRNKTLSPLDLEGENGPVHLPASGVDGGTGDRPGEVTDTPENRVKPHYIELLKAFGQVDVLEDRPAKLTALPGTVAPAAPKVAKTGKVPKVAPGPVAALPGTVPPAAPVAALPGTVPPAPVAALPGTVPPAPVAALPGTVPPAAPKVAKAKAGKKAPEPKTAKKAAPVAALPGEAKRGRGRPKKNG